MFCMTTIFCYFFFFQLQFLLCRYTQVFMLSKRLISLYISALSLIFSFCSTGLYSLHFYFNSFFASFDLKSHNIILKSDGSQFNGANLMYLLLELFCYYSCLLYLGKRWRLENCNFENTISLCCVTFKTGSL